MRLRVFHASTSTDAMAAVRTELGEDAVIVSSREDGEGIVLTAVAPDRDLDLAALLCPDVPEPDTRLLSDVLRWHGVEDELARRLLGVVRAEHGTDATQGLARALQAGLTFVEGGVPEDAPVMVVGPPGAGKTATVAKLAAAMVLDGRIPKVFSTDAGRAGGLGQLADLLRPLGIEPKPLLAREGAMLARGQAQGPVLVDSQGVNPFQPQDIMKIVEISSTIRAGLMLVMPAGLASGDAADMAANFAALGCRRLTVSRLDGARRLGGVLAAAAAGPGLVCAGIGATIGTGLKPFTPLGLARILMSNANEGGVR